MEHRTRAAVHSARREIDGPCPSTRMLGRSSHSARMSLCTHVTWPIDSIVIADLEYETAPYPYDSSPTSTGVRPFHDEVARPAGVVDEQRTSDHSLT